MKKFNFCLFSFMFLSLAFDFQIAYGQEPQTIQEAIHKVKLIRDPDLRTQDRKRAEEAMRIVRNKVKTTNDLSGTALQTLPIDFWNGVTDKGRIIVRDQVLEIARDKNWDMAEVAWMIEAGRCNEHAALMQRILQGAGVGNVVILLSNSPHAFPVVNIALGYDDDIPWTWGPHAFVPDSWQDKMLSSPEEIWWNKNTFAGGNAYVGLTDFTTRVKLKHMAGKGNEYIRQHCDQYKEVYYKFIKIPASIRSSLGTYPDPEKVCKETKFEIISVSLPATAKPNGPRGTLSVTWGGNPDFPVKLVYKPDKCPPGVKCITVTKTFSSETNPIVLESDPACWGNINTPLFFDYSVYLEDAKGIKTKLKNADFTCQPDKENTNGTLLGSWQRTSDKLVMQLTGNENEIVGRITNLGRELAKYHFTVGEQTMRLHKTKNGKYEGQGKWRFTDGRSEWRTYIVTINGDQFTDNFGEQFTRVSK